MVWKGKQASKEERREVLNRAVVSLLNSSTLYCVIIHDAPCLPASRSSRVLKSPSVCSFFLPGLYQSQELPIQHQSGGDDRGRRISNVQATVPVLER